MQLMTKLLKEIEFQTNKVFTKRNIYKPLIEELGYHIAISIVKG